MKKWLCIAALFLLIPGCVSASPRERVFLEGETEPFPEDAVLLTLRVCPLAGADCMLLTLGEHSMLIDAGKALHYDAVRAMIDGAGLTRLEYAFNTHPHDDHIDGFLPLLKAGFPIGTFFTVFPHNYDGGVYRQARTIRAMKKANVPVADLKTEDTIPFGDAQITVYRIPDRSIQPYMDCNNLSGILMIRYGACSVLLTGDVDLLCQPKLAQYYDLKADVMKYPHHGVSTIQKDFLAEVDPEYIFITNGSYDTTEAQRFLIRKGYERMTFASWGMITLQTDGVKWIVRQDILPGKADYVQGYWETFYRKMGR